MEKDVENLDQRNGVESDEEDDVISQACYDAIHFFFVFHQEFAMEAAKE